MAISRYTTPVDPRAAPFADELVADPALAGPLPGTSIERWTSRLSPNRRLAQVAVDLAGMAIIALTFVQTVLPAEVMFHIVFVLLTLHAFLFGLRGTLLRIGIVSIPLLAYANAGLLGWNEPSFDLAEWPLMFVIAVLVAWMADRRDATARHYARLFRQASERLMTVEEDERRRIALELHDSVGQVLTALTLTLDAAGPDEGKGVGSARRLADTALAEVRHLSHWMRPARIEERGLVAAIRDLASQSGFPVRVYVDGHRPFPELGPTTTVGVYRIVQEALANAARHSGSAAAHVSIGVRAGRLSVVVADEGRGFDVGSVAQPGIGLPGMYERAELLGGRLSVMSSIGSGTRVTLDVPLRSAAS